MAKTRKVNKSRKLSPWIQLVTKTYNENKSKAGYAFKDAIKDAKKIYKKIGVQKGKGMDSVSEQSNDSEQKGGAINTKKNNVSSTRRRKKNSFFSRVFG